METYKKSRKLLFSVKFRKSKKIINNIQKKKMGRIIKDLKKLGEMDIYTHHQLLTVNAKNVVAIIGNIYDIVYSHR